MLAERAPAPEPAAQPAQTTLPANSLRDSDYVCWLLTRDESFADYVKHVGAMVESQAGEH